MKKIRRHLSLFLIAALICGMSLTTQANVSPTGTSNTKQCQTTSPKTGVSPTADKNNKKPQTTSPKTGVSPTADQNNKKPQTTSPKTGVSPTADKNNKQCQTTSPKTGEPITGIMIVGILFILAGMSLLMTRRKQA